MSAYIESHQDNEGLIPFVISLAKVFAWLQKGTGFIAKKGCAKADDAAAAATEYQCILWPAQQP